MILDSSAVVAVLCRELGYEKLLSKIALADSLVIGAPTVAESQMVMTIKSGRDAGGLVDQFLAEIAATVVPFGREHISAFHEAFRRFGKGRHPARLNMGDCFTYAIARSTGMPLLFVGDDFHRTDLRAA